MKRAYLIGIVAVVLGLTAHATNLNVYCGGKRFPNTITGALKLLNPQGPNTLTVYGTCNENVWIQGFNRLNLITTTGATINDASGGTGTVVVIWDTTDISLQGFTINGGVVGVWCFNFSVCRFDGNTVQGTSGAAIFVDQSRATFGANTIQNNNADGLDVGGLSSVRTYGGLLIQQNQGQGVFVGDSGFFSSGGDTIQNNAGSGIYATDNGSVFLFGTTVARNSAHGVYAQGHASADFYDANVVTGNAADGVVVMDATYVHFGGENTITGNGWLDVDCEPQYPVTRGVHANIGGGTTNCTEPQTPQMGRGVQSQMHKPVH